MIWVNGKCKSAKCLHGVEAQLRGVAVALVGPKVGMIKWRKLNEWVRFPSQAGRPRGRRCASIEWMTMAMDDDTIPGHSHSPRHRASRKQDASTQMPFRERTGRQRSSPHTAR